MCDITYIFFGEIVVKKIFFVFALMTHTVFFAKTLPWIHLTDQNWKEILFESSRPVVLAVSSDSCSVCRDMENVLHSLYKEYQYDYAFVKLDFKKYPRLGYEVFKIRALPTYIFYLDGIEGGRHVGGMLKNDFRQKMKHYFYS